MKKFKKVKMQLIGLDGNAFAILGRFQREARRQGWEKKDIDRVISLATSGDYTNLLSVMMEYTHDPFEDERAEIMARMEALEEEMDEVEDRWAEEQD